MQSHSISGYHYRMRFSTLVFVFGIACRAMASFDLLLLPGADSKIYRYDPVNNVSLGSFGSGAFPGSTTLDPHTGELVVFRGDATQSYDYSTGALKRVTTGGGGVTWAGYNQALDRIDVLVGGTYLDVITPPFTYQFGPPLGGGLGVKNYIRYGSGVAIGMRITGGDLQMQKWSGGTADAGSNTYGFGGLTAVSNLISFAGTTVFVATVAGSSTLYFVNEPLDEADPINASLTGISITAGYDASMPYYLLPNHTGLYFAGRDSSTGDWRVSNLNYVGGIATYYNSSSVVVPVTYAAAMPSVVLAPEPATMITLGLGLVGILRRRRK